MKRLGRVLLMLRAHVRGDRIERACLVIGLVFIVYAVHSIQEGRKANTRALCVVIDAGRNSILSSAVLPGDVPVDKLLPPSAVVSGEFSLFLQEHGYPPYPIRREATIKAADAYEARIARAIGGDGADACQRLQDASGIG